MQNCDASHTKSRYFGERSCSLFNMAMRFCASTRIFYLYYRVYTPYLKNNHQHKAFRSQSERDWANPTTLSPGSRTDH